jgi:hypothetical protein
VAGRFRLYTDTDVDGPIVKALLSAAWNVLRGIDAYPERTKDYIHFARAAQEGRVLVSNDIDMKLIADTWFLEGRRFPGLVWWPRSHYAVMTPGDYVAAFEDLAAQDHPFANYPIVHIKPKR